MPVPGIRPENNVLEALCHLQCLQKCWSVIDGANFSQYPCIFK